MLARHLATSDLPRTARSHRAAAVRVLWVSLHSAARTERTELAGGLETYLHELAPRLADRGVVVDVVTADRGGATDLVDSLRDRGARYDLVHAHYWTSASAALRARERGLRAPIVTTFHSLAAPRRQFGHPRVTDERVRAETDAARRSDRVVASSKIERSEIQALVSGAAKIEIAPLGVDQTFFCPGTREAAKRAIGVNPSAPMVLFAGRPEPAKGLPTLLDSFSRLSRRIPSARLVVVGATPTEVARLGATTAAVVVRGAVTHSSLVSYYQAADVVAVPSQHETFGLVALEAMSTGVPVVGTRVGALPEIIEDGHTGFLVSVDDGIDLANKLTTLLEDPMLIQRMGRRARKQSMRLSWRAAADRMSRIYRKTLADSNASENTYAR